MNDIQGRAPGHGCKWLEVLLAIVVTCASAIPMIQIAYAYD